MPNNDYANEPNQSRSEEIIQSILDNTEYDEAARSRIEYLLIELKNAIEGGGGGGGVTSYSPLTEKPKIDNHTLQAGNNTSSDLGLQTKIDQEHKLSADNVDDTNSTNKFNVKSDWNAASGATSEILNKPTLGTASAKNVPASGDAATGEVVLGSDTRLTDARNAKDVYNWAKQENKPSYSYSEIQNPPTIPSKLSDLTDDITHRTVTDTEKSAWNGKQGALTFDDAPTSNSNNPVKSGGVYTALAAKQNSLSEAQMLAANSGATAAKVEQIETNKNNILLSEEMNGAKNLCKLRDSISSSNSSYTVTVQSDKSIVVNKTATTSSASSVDLTESITVDTSKQYVLVGNPNTVNDITLLIAYATTPFSWIGEQINDTPLVFTPTSNTVKISIYFRAASSTKTVTIKPMLIEKSLYDAGFTDYQPYALPNTAITPALQECVNNGVKNYSSITGLSKNTTTAGFASETNFGATIPAGTYVVSYDLTRSDNTKTGVIGFRDVDGAYTDIGYYWTTASHQIQTVTFSKAVKAINMYVAAGTTCTMSNLMIQTIASYNAGCTTYQPYAMSNAELTVEVTPKTGDITLGSAYSTLTYNTKYITGIGKIVTLQLYIEFPTALTTGQYNEWGTITDVPLPKYLYRGVCYQHDEYYNTPLATCALLIRANGSIGINPPAGATNKKYIINVSYIGE